MATFIYNGVSLNFTDTGTGPLSVGFHGLLGDSSDFGMLSRRQVASGRRFAALDFPAHGKSDAPTTGYSIPELADTGIAFLRHLGKTGVVGHQKAALIGFSMGGFVAQEVALRPESSDLISSLCLIATSAGEEPPDKKKGYARIALCCRLFGMGVAARHLPGPLLGQKTVRDMPEIANELRRRLRANSKGTLAATQAVLTRRSISGEIRAITVPTLVVCGESDEIRSVSESREIASRIPRARLVCIPQAPHLMLAVPHFASQVGDAIDDFLPAN